MRIGYRLVGGNRYGFNAFYLREDLAVDLVPSVGSRHSSGTTGVARPLMEPNLAGMETGWKPYGLVREVRQLRSREVGRGYGRRSKIT